MGEKKRQKKIIPADEKKIPPDENFFFFFLLRSEKTEQKIETTATVSANDPFSLSGRIYKSVI